MGRVGGSGPTRGSTVVGKAAARRAGVDEGRLVDEVAHPRSVDVGVALELAREVALVVACAQQQAPVAARQLAGLTGQRRDRRVEGDELLAQRLELSAQRGRR